MISGILGSVTGKIAMVAVVAALAGGAWLYHSKVVAERDAAINKAAALQVAKEVQDATIAAQKDAIARWKEAERRMQETLEELAKAQQDAAQYQKELNDVLSKHDLDRLSEGKPGMLERRINRGTARVLRMFEHATDGGRDNDSD